MTKNSSEKYTRTHPVRTREFPFQPETMLAPMEGVTNFTVRTALSRQPGLGILCTEFVRISDHVLSKKSVNMAVQKTEGFPLSVQIMGNDASKMADSAAKVEQAGADVVDVNLGCPTKKAVKGNVGSAMLKDPDLLYDVLSSMRQKVKGWLSAKIRAGFDESGHVSIIAQAVEASGADFIVVHPRRRKDFYNGVADWRIIGLLKSELKIPVVGNGDIWYPKDALRITEETGCDAVMIGRGALRNPWIFQQIKALKEGKKFTPTVDEMIHFFSQLKDDFNEGFEGREHATLARLKEFIKYFSLSFAGGTEFRSAILRKQSLGEFLDGLFAFIQTAGHESLDFDGKLNLMKSGC